MPAHQIVVSLPRNILLNNYDTLLYVTFLHLRYSTIPIMSLSRRIKYSSPSILTSVPAYFANKHLLSNLHLKCCTFAVVQHLAGADRQHFALLRLLFRCIRQHNAAFGDGLLAQCFNDYAITQRLNLDAHCWHVNSSVFFIVRSEGKCCSFLALYV